MNVFFYNSDIGIIPFNIKIAGIGNSTKHRGFIKKLLRNSIHLEIINAHVATNLIRTLIGAFKLFNSINSIEYQITQNFSLIIILLIFDSLSEIYNLAI